MHLNIEKEYFILFLQNHEKINFQFFHLINQ